MKKKHIAKLLRMNGLAKRFVDLAGGEVSHVKELPAEVVIGRSRASMFGLCYTGAFMPDSLKRFLPIYREN